MEHYPRRFLQASLIYLGLGSMLGLALGAFRAWAPVFRYVHIHFMLFGFLSMMVFGVAYHVLPRFTGMPLRHPCAVRLHFYLANAGLLGLGTSYTIKLWFPSVFLTSAFVAAAVVAMASMFLFIFNLAPLVFGASPADVPDCSPQPGRSCAHAAPSSGAKGADSGAGVDFGESVASLSARRPELMEVLARFGIDMCCGGRHSLEEVCRKKGIERESLRQALERASSKEKN
jgi:hypothetical protein